MIKGNKKPLIVAATGSGKSLIIAGIAQSAVSKGNRVIILTHTQEILEQNEKALNLLAPEITTGIYCAGLGRKEKDSQVIFAHRDSLGVNPEILGTYKIAICDEAHLIAHKATTRYQKIFEKLNAEYIIGLTATPWRLKEGNIWGEGKFFDCISYNISPDFLIEQGYLSPYKYPQQKSTMIRAEGLKLNNSGDFDENELEKISINEDIIARTIRNWHALANHRNLSLFFCCSIAHAKAVAKELEKYIDIEKIGYIDGEIKDRESFITKAKSNGFKVIVNCMVLTTGFDLPAIDCVVMLRATKSPSLFVQAIGRGLRKAEGKEDCLILDYTDNHLRFGSLSEPLISNKEKKNLNTIKEEDFQIERQAPKKECPSCTVKVFASTTVCGFCGHIFISHLEEVFKKSPMMAEWLEVRDYTWYKAVTKSGKNCYIVEFYIPEYLYPIKQWLLYEQSGSFGAKAKEFLAILKEAKIEKIFVQNAGNVPKRRKPANDKEYAKITKYEYNAFTDPVEETENPFLASKNGRIINRTRH